MLTAWLAAAMKRAEYEKLEDEDLWYGRIPECRGAWATGDSPESCAQLLESVLEGWAELGLSQGHPIPVIDGIEVARQGEPLLHV